MAVIKIRSELNRPNLERITVIKAAQMPVADGRKSFDAFSWFSMRTAKRAVNAKSTPSNEKGIKAPAIAPIIPPRTQYIWSSRAIVPKKSPRL